MMGFAKVLSTLSLVCMVSAILSNKLTVINSFLQNYVLAFVNRVMWQSFIVIPVVSKLYQASMTSSFMSNMEFCIYMYLYALTISIICGGLLYVYIS